MAREAAASTTAVERLTAYILDGASTDPLAPDLSGWLAASRRFRSFAELHRDKIRKKLRGAADAQARWDVRTELRVASLLLANKRVDLAFEASGSPTGGGPDFTVAFAGQRPLNLEVTRLRRPPEQVYIGRAILAKLRQLPPSVPNALLLSTEADVREPAAVEMAVRSLRARADAKDEAYFDRHGLAGSRGFYDRFLRLGAILAWSDGGTRQRVLLWTNPSARIPVPATASRAIVSALQAG